MDKPKLKPLTLREERFVDEYFIDLNAAQAYIRSGLSTIGAKAGHASVYLHQPHIQAAIKARVGEYKFMIGLTHEQVWREYARLAFFNPGEFFDEEGSFKNVKDIPEDLLVAISAIEVMDEPLTRKIKPRLTRVKFADRHKSLEMLTKLMGMLGPDRLELSGPNGGPLQAEVKVMVYLPSNGREPLEAEYKQLEDDPSEGLA